MYVASPILTRLKLALPKLLVEAVERGRINAFIPVPVALTRVFSSIIDPPFRFMP